MQHTPCSALPDPSILSQEVALLAPALVGYPVAALVDMYAAAGADERIATLEVVDLCLIRWIESLNETIATQAHPPDDEVLSRLHDRQSDARDALLQLKGRLRCDVVHRDGGQAC